MAKVRHGMQDMVAKNPCQIYNQSENHSENETCYQEAGSCRFRTGPPEINGTGTQILRSGCGGFPAEGEEDKAPPAVSRGMTAA